MPSILAAPYDRSITLDLGTGPRSFTLTTTDLPLSRLVTFTRVPSGSCLWAAVNWNMSYGSPLAVVFPWKLFPYQLALPTWKGLELPLWRRLTLVTLTEFVTFPFSGRATSEFEFAVPGVFGGCAASRLVVVKKKTRMLASTCRIKHLASSMTLPCVVSYKSR